MRERVLVFPGGMPRSLVFLERALADGLDVVGASSLGYDPARERYPAWVQLPYVTATDFDAALARAIGGLGITGIFTPNAVVWNYLQRVLPRQHPGMRLVNPSPVAAEVAPYRQAIEFARSCRTWGDVVAASGQQRPALAELQVAALFRHSEGIPGMCDHDKIRALIAVARSCPAGDLVEIGSWWGKSAYVLGQLARFHGIGSLLCVDPWSNAHLVQNDEKGLVDSVPVDAEEALTVFQLNLLPYAQGALNYLRLPSVEASEAYRRTHVVHTSVFGATEYAGRIALLHVDGNHSYESARADVAAWADLVLPGGWLVVDDYIWPYGDGPQRVGDEFLRAQHERVSCAFVMGSALFIQMRA